jgi:hypothetical protein
VKSLWSARVKSRGAWPAAPKTLRNYFLLPLRCLGPTDKTFLGLETLLAADLLPVMPVAQVPVAVAGNNQLGVALGARETIKKFQAYTYHNEGRK